MVAPAPLHTCKNPPGAEQLRGPQCKRGMNLLEQTSQTRLQNDWGPGASLPLRQAERFLLFNLEKAQEHLMTIFQDINGLIRTMERDLLQGSAVFTLFARGNCFKLKEAAEFHCPERRTTVTAGWERPRHPLPGAERAPGSHLPRLGSSQKPSSRGFPAEATVNPAGAGQATELVVSSHEMAAGACSWLSQPGVPQGCLRAQGACVLHPSPSSAGGEHTKHQPGAQRRTLPLPW